MTKNRRNKEYPRRIIDRIAANQMRLTPEDGELYENAIRNIYAAFDIAEQYTNRIIVHCDVTFGLSELRMLVDIPTAPVAGIKAIRYYDADDVLQELSADNYQLLTSEHTTTIELYSIPRLSALRRMNRVLIDATCGYGDYRDVMNREPAPDGALPLPGNIEAAVQLMAGTLCEADGDAIIGRSVSSLPITAERLLNPYRISPYGWQD